MLEHVLGIVIKTKDYGESHKIVTLFCAKLGKINILARGAKKTKSRMAAITQPFVHGDFYIYKSKGLGTLQQGEVINSFRGIREDIFKTAYMAYLLELTDKVSDWDTPYMYIHNELLSTLQWINDNQNIDIPILMYEMKIFHMGGFAPVVGQCVNCGNRDGLIGFSISEGGVLCKQCVHTDEFAVQLKPALIKVLDILLNVSLNQIGTISVKQENLHLLRNIMDEYYERYGSYYLKSKRFIKQMKHLK